MFCIAGRSRKMPGKERANSFDAMHKSVGELSTLETRPHRFDDFAPKILPALGVNTGVADDGKAMGSRSDKNQNTIVQRRAVHLKFSETTTRNRQCVRDVVAADQHKNLSARMFFCLRDGGKNPVVINCIKKLASSHDFFPGVSPAAAGAAAAAIASTAG